MGMIHLPNMRFYTYNGVFDEEKKLGQQIAVDVTAHYPIETAVKDDDLSTTISYVDVYQRVEAIVTTSQFNLMESLANALLVALLTQFPQVDKIDVAVHKDYIPLPGIYDPFIIQVSGTQTDLSKWAEA
ncbi:dihydroneopterin aldolase [Leuconostoc lactis]|uniref:dihydroneopterin aldolase n=1 Tax=Leuconostoc lactis TaxID=1246 RepID=UPI0002195F42|nr:dihydroneopterin aldolase [Leuconostoc lactis]GHC26084.1 7,8-dihydroneopterin aldolase [Leuconostoc lactis KCTC 3528 = DSM 20202]